MKTRLVVALLIAAHLSATAADRVRIAVMGLFHPQRLVVETVSSSPLVMETERGELLMGDGARRRVMLERDGERLLVLNGAERIAVREARFAARQVDADFVLAVPGKMRRLYRGQLVIRSSGGELQAVVSMNLETAVASVVAAEAPADAPLEALKAQAVVTRSYLLAAGPRHSHAEFCDTTHCQYLRRPPQPESSAARAARATAGLVLNWRGTPVGAMYSASCGGRTHTAAEIGYAERGYPYFAVECPYCRRSPERWSVTLAEKDASAVAKGERERLKAGRILGWRAVPSNSFSLTQKNSLAQLSGAGRGHGIGMCQLGAVGLAREGMNFRAILAHYFPNTTVEAIPGR